MTIVFGVFGELGSARKDWRGGGEWVPSLERHICASVDFFFELSFGLARGRSVEEFSHSHSFRWSSRALPPIDS